MGKYCDIMEITISTREGLVISEPFIRERLGAETKLVLFRQVWPG